MKRFLSFTKKRRGFSPSWSDSGSTSSLGNEIKEKDLGKLHKAAFTGDLTKVKQLSKKNDVNQLDREQRTPLHLACTNGYAEVAEFLVENKAEINLCDSQHRSPLMKAVQCQQERCLTILLERNADPNLVDINGNSALHLTALIPSISMAELLLEHEANVNCQNKDGCTPLMLAVTENHIEMAEFLLEEGAAVNVGDTMGRSSLMIAASNGQISLVRLLLQYEADVGMKDTSGLTADNYAVRNGHHACSHLIIEHWTKKSPTPPFHLSSSEKKSVPVLDPSDNEDNSLEEPLSGESRSGTGDSWHSSDEDEKPQKINLRKLIGASHQHRRSDAGQEDMCSKEGCTSKPLNDSQEEDNTESIEDEEQSDEENKDDDDGEEDEEEADEEDDDNFDESEESEEEEEDGDDDHTVEGVTGKGKLGLSSSINKTDLLSSKSQVDCLDLDEENPKRNDAHPTVDAEVQNKPNLSISFTAKVHHDACHSVDSGKDEEGLGDEREKLYSSNFNKTQEGVPDIRFKGMMAGRMTVALESEDEPWDSDVDMTPGNDCYAESEKITKANFSSKDGSQQSTEKSKQAIQELARKILHVGDPTKLSSNDELRSSRDSVGSSDRQSCIDWGDERSDKEDRTQTIIDSEHPSLEVEPQSTEKNRVNFALTRKDTLTKTTAVLNTKLGTSKQAGLSAHEKDDDNDDDYDEEKKNKNMSNSKEEDADENQDHHVSAETVSQEPAHEEPDFLSKLGLEAGGDHEEVSIWDSESGSDIPRNQEATPTQSRFKAQQVRQNISEGNRKDVMKMACIDDGDPDDSSAWDSSTSVSRNMKNHERIMPLKSEPEADANIHAAERAGSPARKPSPFLSPNIPKPQPRTRIFKPVKSEEVAGVKSCSLFHEEQESGEEVDLVQEKYLPSSSESDKYKHPLAIMESKAKGNSEEVRGSSVASVNPKGSYDDSDSGEESLDEDKTKGEEMRWRGYDGYGDLGAVSKIKQVRAHYRSVTAELKEKFKRRVLKGAGESGERRSSQEEDSLGAALDEKYSHEEEEAVRFATSGLRVSGTEDSVSEPVDSLIGVIQQCSYTASNSHRTNSSMASAENAENLQVDRCREQSTEGEENKLSHKTNMNVNQDNAKEDHEISDFQGRKFKENCTLNKNNAYSVSSQEAKAITSKISFRDTEQNMKDSGSKEDPKHSQVLTPSPGSAAPSHLLYRGLQVDVQRFEQEIGEEKKAEHLGSEKSAKTKEIGVRKGLQNNPDIQKTRDMEMADCFDFTQSIHDKADKMDPPGYEDSMLLKHLASCKGSMSTVKYQDALQEYEWVVERESAQSLHMLNKLSQLKVSRSKLKQIFKDMCDSRSALELQTLELEAELKNIRFILKQEQEKHSNTTVLYKKTCEQLKAMETQYHAEVEERQKVELIMSNLELEMKMFVSNMKQLEEDHKETQHMLAQESNARALQEILLNNHLQRQKETEEENRRNLKESKEVMAQLTKASDREKEHLQENRSLQEQVTSLRMKLEWAHAQSKQGEGQDSEEIEILREKLEDNKRNLKLSEEALAQTVLQYNGQMNVLRTECTVATTKLEHERQAREKLEVEAESARGQLVATLQELEHSQLARADLEQALQRERDDSKREQEKHTCELASQCESIHSLSQQLGAAEVRIRNLEQELHRSKLSLTEKSLLLERVQLEHNQAQPRLVQLESNLKAEQEQAQQATAQYELTEKRLAQVQEEVMFLRQRLEESQNVHVHFSELLAKLRSEWEERVTMADNKSKEMVTRYAELREEFKRQEQEKKEEETAARQLSQELADTLKKLAVCEASLEVNQQHRANLKEENRCLQRDNDDLKEKLQDREKRCIEAECLTQDSKEQNVIITSKEMRGVRSASAGTDKTEKQLEEAMCQLKTENTKLETIIKQQTHKIEALQKRAQEAAAVRSRLEDLVTHLQGSKINLEDQLSQELLKKNMLSQNIEENHHLWEEELKSRSKMSLRLAMLEKEKGELSTQVEDEKKKVKWISEQKKSADIRLDQEIKRNSELYQEMYRLKTLVKVTKTKLKEQEKQFALQSTSLPEKTEHRLPEVDVKRIKSKLEEVSVQLDEEAEKCKRLERVNQELKEKLSNYKVLVKSHQQLEKSKRQLEEDMTRLRRQIKTEMMDQSQAEQYRREIMEQAQKEVQQKLEEVNLFLQNQAASHNALEQMKAANEASLRTQMEQRLQELEKELSRLRSSYQDSLSQRDSIQIELDRFRQLYTEELGLRKGLAAKLERSNERLAEAHTRLLTERQHSISLISSGMANGTLSRPDLELGALGTFGAMLGPLNKNMALEGSGGNILSPRGDMQSSKVEAYLAQMQNDLEKKISKELGHVMVEQDGSSSMSPLCSGTGSQKSLAGDQDAVNRATQQYLEVLKKNYML